MKYKYLGLQLDDRLDETINMDTLLKKEQSCLYFLRRIAKNCFTSFTSLWSPVSFSMLWCAREEAAEHRAGHTGDSNRDPGQTALHPGQPLL